MDNIRVNKVSRLIQKELADIFQLRAKEIAPNVMITVTAVRVTKDLSLARVYLSIFNVPDKASIIKAINENRKELRLLLGQRVKNQLRIIPELEFIHDDTLDYIDRIDELLKQ